MNAKYVLVPLIAAAFLATACGTIQSHRLLDQPTGEILTTGVGGTIFRLNKVGDLPNAFGGRDVWGGKTDRGFAEMRLVAIDGATISIEILDVNRNPTETVMDRYKPFQSQVTTSVDISAADTGDLRPYLSKLDTGRQRQITIAGIRVTFTDVQEYSIQYTLEDTTGRYN